MHKYLFIILVSLFSITTVCAESSTVPSLEFDQEEQVDDMDELFVQTAAEKLPLWKMKLQQWGTVLVAYLLRIKQYSIEQFEKAKVKIYALMYKKNSMVAEKS